MVRAKVVEVEQGSDEWLALRRRRLTASRMGDVMAKKTTKRYQDYQQQIVFELLGYEEEEEEAAPHFAHGRAMEPYARGAYEWKYNCKVTADVFCIHPEHDWMACSPDGLVLPDMEVPIEIKCREKYATYHDKVARALRLEKIDACYRPQVQAQMWVMGVPLLKFVEYYHDSEMEVRKMHVMDVKRDDDYINQMSNRAADFFLECCALADVDPVRPAA